MTKYEFNYLQKQIEAIQVALVVVSDEKERRKMFRRLGGLELLRDSEINKSYGVIV